MMFKNSSLVGISLLPCIEFQYHTELDHWCYDEFDHQFFLFVQSTLMERRQVFSEIKQQIQKSAVLVYLRSFLKTFFQLLDLDSRLIDSKRSNGNWWSVILLRSNFFYLYYDRLHLSRLKNQSITVQSIKINIHSTCRYFHMMLAENVWNSSD